MRSAFDWLFRHRRTGEIVIGQFPNTPLWVFLACSVIRLGFHPTGVQGSALSLVGAAALVIWAGDEVVRGVNPWRRILGGAVLLGLVAGRV